MGNFSGLVMKVVFYNVALVMRNFSGLVMKVVFYNVALAVIFYFVLAYIQDRGLESVYPVPYFLSKIMMIMIVLGVNGVVGYEYVYGVEK